MIEIIPAIMPKDYEDLHSKVGLVVGLAPLVQIDIMDGVYVANRSWPYIHPNDSDFNKIIKEEEGLPYWDQVDYEFDLMVRRPDRDVMPWIMAGAKRLIFHFNSMPDISVVTAGLDSHTRENIEVGIALGIEDPLSVIDHFIHDINFVQLMGIVNIGYQGEVFDQRTIDRVSELRANHPGLMIAVDGGVNLDNAKLLIEAGVNRLTVGSAVFGAVDVKVALDDFHAMAAEY